MALDAITTPTIVEAIPFSGKTIWCLNGNEADASTAIDIKAAPGAGKSLYIQQVLITSDDADCHPHLEDGDGNVLFGPFYTTAEGMVVCKKFDRPMKLTTNKSLALKAAAAGNISVYVEGATAED